MDDFVFGFFQQLEWSLIIISIFAVLAGSITQGLSGLGFGMVTAPILLLIDPIFVPGPMLMLAMTVSMLVVFRDREHIDYKILGTTLSGRIPGTIIAAFAFSLIPLALYGIIFGILVLIAVILTSTKLKVMPTRINIIIAGFASGFMGTLTSIGAPPMALVFQHGQVKMVRSTLSTFFFIGCFFSLTVLFYFGSFTVKHIFITAFFIPPLLIGFKISSLLVHKVNQKVMRYFMISISGISSVILIIKSTISFYF